MKVGDRLYFKDGSWGDRKLVVQSIDGDWVRFKGENGKPSAPFLSEWLSSKPKQEHSPNTSVLKDANA